MNRNAGNNAQDIKILNRSLVLKLICTNSGVSRGDIARMTQLTKMTTSNIISELLAQGIISESKHAASPDGSAAGRRPGLLDIAETSPCICGIFIGRRHCSVLFSDYKAHVFAKESTRFDEMLTAERLVSIIVKSFYNLKRACTRPIIGVGISAVGPLNACAGIILKPPNFYGIQNLPIVELLSSALGYPCVLINDASSGALAEKLYGHGKALFNFVYLHLHDGIGTGLVVDDKLFDGDIGLSGEMGHTSINFMGSRCDCGNIGCLEMYANDKNVIERAKFLLRLNHNSLLAGREPLTWPVIVGAADEGDGLAISVLDTFCEYISVALVNYLNLVDSHVVIVGYEGGQGAGVLERLLETKVNEKLLASEYRSVRVIRSFFKASAPTIGSVAVVTDRMFSGLLPFCLKP